MSELAESTSWQESVDAGNQSYGKGRIAQAEIHFKRALELAEQFKEGDLRLPATMNNLAAIYQVQGKYAFAESLYKRSLALYERAHGRQHQDVALNLHNLAVLYSAQRKFAEAEPLFREALAIRESVLGADHPDLVPSLRNLAELLRRTARDEAAAVLEGRVTQITVKAASGEDERPS